MKIFRGISKVTKPFVNFPAWMGLKQISSSGKNIKETATALLRQTKSTRQETFEEAVKRLGLNEQILKQRQQMFFRMAVAYSVMALALFSYAVYLLITDHFAAGFMSLVLTVVLLTLAFRQHFWYFEIKQRRLGCTVKEWFFHILGVAK
jgi:intracellular multiplication protein IcmV